MPRLFLPALLFVSWLHPAAAQVTDAFSDGDFTSDPAWTGSTDRWTVADLDGNPALRTDGLADADTIYLATPSEIAYGTWALTFAYQEVNLSTANGARVFLLADTDTLAGSVRGYFLQLGTNNSDEIRLYRQDGDAATGRVELGRSEAALLSGDTGRLSLQVTRDREDTWTVAADDDTLFQATDPTYTTSAFFGLWVKHAAATGTAYAFDDIAVTAPVDTTAPRVTNLVVESNTRLRVVFDEETENGCTPTPYVVSDGIGAPDEVICPLPTEETTTTEPVLVFATSFEPSTEYALTIRGLRDRVGNATPTTVIPFLSLPEEARPDPGDVVVNEIMYDPPENGSEYVELFNRSDQAFDLSRFTLADSRDAPVALTSVPTTVPPDAYVVLVSDSAAFAEAFPDAPFLELPAWPTLNNGGDVVTLRFDDLVIDSVAYDPRWGGDGVALERRDPEGPSSAASNWASSTDSRGGTPGARNSVFEIDTTPPQPLALTVAATGDTLAVRFSEALAPETVESPDFTLTSAGTPPQPAEARADSATATLVLSGPLSTGTYQLIVRDVADLKGNVLDEATLTFSFVQPAQPAPRELVVNEIMYDPADGENEYVELLNRSDETFDAQQFTLSDDRSAPVAFSDQPLSIAPGDYVVLVRDSAAFVQAFPSIPFLEVAPWPALNNGGDAVVVRAGDLVIDSVGYAASWGGDGVSLERRDPEGPSDAVFNWGSSVDVRGGTPGAANTLLAPDRTPPQPLFAERVASDTVDVWFDEPLAPVSPSSFRFERAAALSAQRLDNGLRVRLVSSSTSETLTIEGVRDLTGNALSEATLPLAAQPEARDLVLNEVMYDPLARSDDGLPDQPEYVEIYNRSGALLSLNQLFVTDRPDEDGVADTLRLGERLVAISPGGYALLVAAPDGEAPPAEMLAEAFPDIDFAAPSVVLLAVARSSLGLTNSGDLIQLHRRDGLTLDAVPYDPAWHNANVRDATGLALERIDPEAPSDEPTNWTTSVAAAGGTPGTRNSVTLPDDVVLGDVGLTIEPSPFSPDGDGFEDTAFLRYTLSATASLIRVRIFDAQGRHVRTLEQAALAGRTGQLTWDGLDDAGRALRLGIYVVLLEALDTAGGTTEAFKAPVVVARPLG